MVFLLVVVPLYLGKAGKAGKAGRLGNSLLGIGACGGMRDLISLLGEA